MIHSVVPFIEVSLKDHHVLTLLMEGEVILIKKLMQLGSKYRERY
jgi:hypothetical protein